MELFLLVLLLVVVLAVLYLSWRTQERAARVERRQQELSSLAFLPDRVQALTREVEGLDLEALQRELDLVHEGLRRVEDLASAPATVEERAAPPRPTQVRAAVTRFLREEGYQSIQVLSEDDALEEDPCVVRVQAMRRGVQARGEVRVAGGEVSEAQLEPAYSAFP